MLSIFIIHAFSSYLSTLLFISYISKAEEFLKKSLECAEIAKAKENMSSCYLNLSSVYTAMQDYLKAMECIEKAIQVRQLCLKTLTTVRSILVHQNFGCYRSNFIIMRFEKKVP